jgi:hypothetical protein
MLCSIYKWQISRALDSGKPPSGLVKRHLRRCPSCSEFFRLGEEMGNRLAQDAAALLRGADASLGKKVFSLLDVDERVHLPAPAPRKSWGLRPVLAAAASLTLVSISLVWVLTSRHAKMPALDPAFGLEPPGVYLEKALEKAGSPYAAEIQVLKQALKSKGDAIQSCLDLNLGEKTK